MGGICSDYANSPYLSGGATRLDGGLCRLNDGPYAGLITYNNGQVARLAPARDPNRDPDNPGQFLVEVSLPPASANRTITLRISQEQLTLLQTMQGAEIGLCRSNGSTYQIQQLPLTVEGQSVFWTPEQQRTLLPFFRNESDHVYLCADTDGRGVLGINTSSGQGLNVRGIVTDIRDRCRAILGSGSELPCRAWSEAAQQLTPPEGTRSPSWFEWLLFVTFAYGPLKDIYSSWRKRGGDDDDPPTPPSPPIAPTPEPQPAPESQNADNDDSHSFWEGLGWGALGVLGAIGTAALVLCPFDGPVGETAAGTATLGAFAKAGAAFGL